MTARRWARWVAGSAAGAAFVPIGVVASLRARRSGTMSAIAAPLARSRVGALWRFCRPHTIIGTALSVLGIFAIAAHTLGYGVGASTWSGRWSPRLSVNVFIVGINQLTDVEIDRINKPRLPLASGELTLQQGRAIVAASARAAARARADPGLDRAAVGRRRRWPSAPPTRCPPLRLKRFPALAAASISIVRALVVNLGVYLHFSAGDSVAARRVGADAVRAARSRSRSPCSRTCPDAEGDRRFAIRTFTVRLGGRAAFAIGHGGADARLPGHGDRSASRGADRAVLAATHLARARAAVGLGGARPRPRRLHAASTCACGCLFFAEYLIVPGRGTLEHVRMLVVGLEHGAGEGGVAAALAAVLRRGGLGARGVRAAVRVRRPSPRR